jgi:hypothetical protein
MMPLIKYANDMGYHISRQKGSVNYSIKTIYLDSNEYDITKQSYLLSHELGHIQVFRFLSSFKLFTWYYKLTKKHLLIRMLNECVAWLIGFFLCIRFKVPLKGFYTYAFDCLKTYS